MRASPRKPIRLFRHPAILFCLLLFLSSCATAPESLIPEAMQVYKAR